MGKTGRVIELSDDEIVRCEEVLLIYLEEREKFMPFSHTFCTRHVSLLLEPMMLYMQRYDVCSCIDDRYVRELTYDEVIDEYQRMISTGLTEVWNDLVDWPV